MASVVSDSFEGILTTTHPLALDDLDFTRLGGSSPSNRDIPPIETSHIPLETK